MRAIEALPDKGVNIPNPLGLDIGAEVEVDRISAGKRRSARRRKGNEHLQSLLVECAWAAVRRDGYLKSLYHRHVMKWGGYRSATAKKKAIVVVAHAKVATCGRRC